MHNTESILIPDDDFGSDFDYAAEEGFLGEDSDNLPGPVLSPTQYTPNLKPNTLRSNSPFAENPPQSSTSSMPVEMCVICNDAPAYRDGPNIYPTCGMTCASKLQAASGLPNSNKPRTSDPPNSDFMPSVPLNNFDDNSSWAPKPPSRSSVPTRTYADTTRFHPNRIRMCHVCHVRPQCQRGGRIYPTCGLSCAAKLHSPGPVEMCDHCKKRPKVVINGKTYPQCGKTCRDKAKLAETAAICTSCILCWKSAKKGVSDFCSEACESLADIRAPFLIEIPRGHVAFKKIAEFFASEWQTSKTHCPTIKRVYMVVVKKSFKTSFEKYRTSPQNGILHKQRTVSKRWLVFSRECGFGDPGDLEPCSSNKCLLCSIVRSSFNRSDFPGGIPTSGLNRTVELYRSGKKSSSKIAALTQVVVGREAQMRYHDVQVVRPLPPQNTDSVHIIEVRNDGSRVDLGEIIVYDGDAVWPLYLISYE